MLVSRHTPQPHLGLGAASGGLDACSDSSTNITSSNNRYGGLYTAIGVEWYLGRESFHDQHQKSIFSPSLSHDVGIANGLILR